ncbi:2-dehydro-3-deoxygalactonokinase [Paracoccus sp. WLY502]|uniref:2-dehydro-3-deoxygalactonokinase n=1 Tax=Paracoccus yibinensis TaxID=3068891 RepID=UPI002796CB33|nr:2-dehydro-3-deoxygalactonokinase [Paracoccus sp. WLY502]MDQ1898903.1 2-dehydro-3-deoxygalactonokinase [Paracoccus sp. WLY502]
MDQADWAAVELAAGELRLWLMEGGESVTASCGDDPGQTLRALLLPMLEGGQVMDVVACGWPGVEPVRVPCPPPPPAVPMDLDPRIRLHALPGLVQDRPLDLLARAVPLIGGHLAVVPDFDGVLCLPGQPSAWVQISAGEIVSFRSFLTAEILSALDAAPRAAFDKAAFTEGVAQAMSRPASLAADLSSARAGLALGRTDRAAAGSRMAGLMIGVELAAARPWWLGQNVVIIGDCPLTELYVEALAAQGVIAAKADPEQTRLAGMRAARPRLSL